MSAGLSVLILVAILIAVAYVGYDVHSGRASDEESE